MSYTIIQKNYAVENVRPAGYDLRLGNEHAIGGEKKKPLNSNDNRYVRIPPHEVAILSTYEKLRMPKNIIGRWNLRVTKVYEGLLWTGGPQVDPGFDDYLRCPVYNMSDNDVELEYGSNLFSIDFVNTMPYISEICDDNNYELKKYIKRGKGIRDFKNRRKEFNDYRTNIKSAPAKLRDKVEETERLMNRFRSTVFGIISILIVALSILTVMSSNGLPNFSNLVINGFNVLLFLSLIMILLLVIHVIYDFFANKNILRKKAIRNLKTEEVLFIRDFIPTFIGILLILILMFLYDGLLQISISQIPIFGISFVNILMFLTIIAIIGMVVNITMIFYYHIKYHNKKK